LRGKRKENIVPKNIMENIENTFISIPKHPYSNHPSVQPNTVNEYVDMAGGGSTSATGILSAFSFIKNIGSYVSWKWIVSLLFFSLIAYLVNSKPAFFHWIYNKHAYIKNDTLYISHEQIRDELSL
jgi:hypothetical protein